MGAVIPSHYHGNIQYVPLFDVSSTSALKVPHGKHDQDELISNAVLKYVAPEVKSEPELKSHARAQTAKSYLKANVHVMAVEILDIFVGGDSIVYVDANANKDVVSSQSSSHSSKSKDSQGHSHSPRNGDKSGTSDKSSPDWKKMAGEYMPPGFADYDTHSSSGNLFFAHSFVCILCDLIVSITIFIMINMT